MKQTLFAVVDTTTGNLIIYNGAVAWATLDRAVPVRQGANERYDFPHKVIKLIVTGVEEVE